MTEAADYVSRLDLTGRALAFLAKHGGAKNDVVHAPSIAKLTGIPARTVYRWLKHPTAAHGKLLDQLLTAARTRGFKG